MNNSVLNELNPHYSLEVLIIKLKLKYFVYISKDKNYWMLRMLGKNKGN